MTPAEQIKEARGALSRAEASKRTGIPAVTIEKWERGERTPKPYSLPNILEMLRQAQPEEVRP